MAATTLKNALYSLDIFYGPKVSQKGVRLGAPNKKLKNYSLYIILGSHDPTILASVTPYIVAHKTNIYRSSRAQVETDVGKGGALVVESFGAA